MHSTLASPGMRMSSSTTSGRRALDQRHDLVAASRLADHVDVLARLERPPQPLQDQGMVVRDQDLQNGLSFHDDTDASAATGRNLSAGDVAQSRCVSPAAAGGRDSSASEVIVSEPRAADSSTSVASSSERA